MLPMFETVPQDVLATMLLKTGPDISTDDVIPAGARVPNHPERTGVATESIIDRIDHFVLTVRSLDVTCAFYSACLGMKRVDTAGRPTALHFGTQKINVHEADHTFEPKAAEPRPGSADFCLITTSLLGEVINRLENHGVPIELGPVERTGALGAMTSVYFRDPDRNLVEVSRYGQ